MSRKSRIGRPAPLQGAAVEKLRVVSAWLRDYITAIKNGNIHPFTSMERKVREATRNEPWGPTGTMLNELAEASFDATDCEIIFAVIQLRLGCPPEKWRNVYKALVLLDFLLLRGSQQSVQITEEELLHKLEDLEMFAFTTPEGKDQGVNVRHRAKAVKELMLEPGRLKAERAGFQRKRTAYQGFTRDQLAAGKPFHDDQDIQTPRASRSGLRRTLSDSSMQDSKPSPMRGEPEPSSLRMPGETKGVTMEMNKKQLAELKLLLDLPENRYCADCVGGGGAARATWASINNGVFLCMRCAGVHRGLGTHVSQVRSCTLDTWLPEQVRFMGLTGNVRANCFFEARLDPELKPLYGSGDLEPFIRRKYTVRAYAAGEWPPVEVSAKMADAKGLACSEDSNPTDDPQLAGPSHPQKLQPRLQGSKSSRQASSTSSSRHPVKILSIPLPSAAAQPQAAEPSASADYDLMGFDPVETETLDAAEGFPAMQPQDAFAELEMLQPVSLLDYDAVVYGGALPGDNRDFLPYAAVDSFAVPAMTQQLNGGGAAFPLLSTPQQSAAASPQWPSEQPGFPQPGSSVAVPTSAASEASDVGFQGESVQDWSEQPLKAGGRGLPRLHVHATSVGAEAELNSLASTPFLTPRFTALHGPGVSKSAAKLPPQRAEQSYLPPGVAHSRVGGGHLPTSALAQSTKQWTAKANQDDKGLLDDLVLQAVAELPPTRSGGAPIQEVLAAAQAPKPPSMLQQRAGSVQ